MIFLKCILHSEKTNLKSHNEFSAFADGKTHLVLKFQYFTSNIFALKWKSLKRLTFEYDGFFMHSTLH